jgi:hypothetical protein
MRRITAMAAPKRPPLPLILMANDLLEGDVLFVSASGWTKNPAEALIAYDEPAAEALEAAGQAAFKAQAIVDPVLVDISVVEGRPVPNHFRERFRTLGPSVRPDLGKQAEFQEG